MTQNRGYEAGNLSGGVNAIYHAIYHGGEAIDDESVRRHLLGLNRRRAVTQALLTSVRSIIWVSTTVGTGNCSIGNNPVNGSAIESLLKLPAHFLEMLAKYRQPEEGAPVTGRAAI